MCFIAYKTTPELGGHLNITGEKKKELELGSASRWTYVGDFIVK
jgi:hypothetical protein